MKKGKFAKVREGFGVVGMELNLNLTQCQAFNFYLKEIKSMIEKSEDGKIQIQEDLSGTIRSSSSGKTNIYATLNTNVNTDLCSKSMK
jgi:hypothetical protein